MKNLLRRYCFCIAWIISPYDKGTNAVLVEHNLCLYNLGLQCTCFKDSPINKSSVPVFQWVEETIIIKSNIIFALMLMFVCLCVQPTAVPLSPWQWCAGSCPASPTPLNCAARAQMSSWSRAPTMAAPMTRSATQTPPRWKIRGATSPMHTR